MDRIERYKIEDLKNIPSKKVFTNFGLGNIDLVELHVYGGDTLLATEYDIESFRIDKHIKRGRKRKRPRIELDIHNDIRKLGLSSGLYKAHYNFFRDILGSCNENNGLHISEISPSRTEIRIETTSQNSEFLRKFEELQEKNVEEFIDEGWQDLLANFGDNNVLLIINWTSDGGDGILLKLYEPLPDNIQVKQQLWIVKEVITSHTEMIRLVSQSPQKQGTNIAGPNFTIDIVPGIGGETGWETWDTILGTNTTTKQKLLNKYVSGSAYESTLLNIDYHNYNNFVHFSSAKERLENFKYKLGLIEYYDGQITTLNAMESESVYNTSNLNSYTLKKEEVVNGFDGYESYLYFESSSYAISSNGATYERTWPKSNAVEPYTNRSISDSIATAWFTSQSTVALDYDVHNPHNLENVIPFHVREAGDGNDNANYMLFTNMVAHHFDTVYNYAEQSVQIHKRNNPLYEGLSKDLVYNVLSSFGWESYQGFHFTDLWEYAFGQNEDATYSNSGSSWPLHISGSDVSTRATAGKPITGSIKYITASPTQSSQLISREDISRETWKRMLNNLPYLLKTKGSERGIRALTTTYGLPPTLLRIFEYGGPQKEKTTDSYAKYDKFSYSLEFDGVDSTIKFPWGKLNPALNPLVTVNRNPDALEFRFKTRGTTRNKSVTQSVMIFADTLQLKLEPHESASTVTSGYYNHGKLTLGCDDGSSQFYGSTEYLPLYDDDWWNVMVSRHTASYGAVQQTLRTAVAKSADHSNARITHTGSALTDLPTTEVNMWNAFDWGYLGGMVGSSAPLSSSNTFPFSGSMQELRTWVLPEGDQTALDYWNELKPFHNHVLSPLSIEGYGATGSYEQLVQRYPLGADLNRYSSSWDLSTTEISGSQPSVYKRVNPFVATFANTLATASGFANDLATDWQTEEEKYYTAMPDLVRTREIGDKVRIESTTLKGRLSDRLKVEKSQFDKAPLDSNRVGVYFAPNFNIDLDIAHELGGADFHNYVGNPLDYRDDEYKSLRVLRSQYWKKHNNPFNFFEYLGILRYIDHTLFRQIEHLIPARCNAQVGLLVKANMLERPKVANLQEYIEENHYDGILAPKRIVTANTTTLGGPYHQWLNPKNNKWETGSALQAHTGYLAEESGSNYGAGFTEQSTGEVEASIDVRKHFTHDIDRQGSRYDWDNMHWYVPSSSQGIGYWNNPTASVVQGGASYENAGDFLSNFADGTLSASAGYGATDFYGFDNFELKHVTNSFATTTHLKHYNYAYDHPKYGHSRRPVKISRFNDRGNIKYYHHQKTSRIYHTYKYHYFAPKNNMHNSASTGGHHSAGLTQESMSGYPPAMLSNGFFRSGLRPVSKSLQRAEHQDYMTYATNNLLYGGCKLIASDFNMPVITTVDGGPVIEITDTNPNQLIISTPSAGAGAIQAVNTGNSIR